MSLTEFLVYCDIVLNKIIVCMKRFSILAVLAVLAALAVSCGGSGKKLLPNVSGKAGEVIVVINQGEWEGEVGDGIRTLLARLPFPSAKGATLYSGEYHAFEFYQYFPDTQESAAGGCGSQDGFFQGGIQD